MHDHLRETELLRVKLGTSMGEAKEATIQPRSYLPQDIVARSLAKLELAARSELQVRSYHQVAEYLRIQPVMLIKQAARKYIMGQSWS